MMNVFPPATTREFHHMPTDFTARRNTNGTKTKRITGHTHIETEAHLLCNNSNWGWTCTMKNWSPLMHLEASRCTRFTFSISMTSPWQDRSKWWKAWQYSTPCMSLGPSEEERLDTGEWLASGPGHFTPVENAPIFNSIEGWLGSTAGLNTVTKNFAPCQESTPDSPVFLMKIRYLSHNSDRATRFS